MSLPVLISNHSITVSVTVSIRISHKCKVIINLLSIIVIVYHAYVQTIIYYTIMLMIINNF